MIYLKLKNKYVQVAVVSVSVIVFFCTFLFLSNIKTFAQQQTAAELRNKIEQSSAEIIKLEQEIAEANRTINTLSGQKQTLSNEISRLDLTQSTLTKQLSLTEKKISAADLLIQRLTNQISDKKEIVVGQKDAIAKSMRNIYIQDKESIVLSLVSGGNLSDTWRDIDQMIYATQSLRDNIHTLNQTRIDLEDNRNLEEDTREELLALKGDLVNQKNIITQNKKEKDSLLSQTKNRESEYQKLLAEKLARKATFEKEMGEAESALKFILDPSSIPKSGSSPLSWPLDNITITQYFGKTVDAKRLYVSGTHNGMDFRAAVGTRVLSAASGTVLAVGNTDATCPGASYGKWVFVRHNNGLSTLYAHLSTTTAIKGQSVSSRQIIGYSGNTGYATGPHLHFTVFASNGVSVQDLPSKACNGKVYTMPIAATNAYLDPILYLPSLN